MIAFVPFGMAQTRSAQEGEPAAGDTVEKIAVDSNKSLQNLRRDVDKAEARFFAVFNSFNRDSDYDVHCDYEESLGSRRKVHECKAAFHREYEADLALTYNDSFSGVGERSPPSESRFKKKYERYQKKIAEAVAEHPELREALNEFATAKQMLESDLQR